MSTSYLVANVENHDFSRLRENIMHFLGLSGFRVIVADPPWSYRNAGVEGSAAGEYPTMTTEDICALPVSGVAHADAVLLLWATWPCLTDAMRVIDAWGFKYVTGMPWIKVVKCQQDLWGEWDIRSQWGIGFWVHGVSEPILVCRRGNAKPPKQRFVGLIAPNIRHSRKPDNLHEYAEALPGPRLELFARRPREGWTVWGNEVEANGAPHGRAAPARTVQRLVRQSVLICVPITVDKDRDKEPSGSVAIAATTEHSGRGVPAA